MIRILHVVHGMDCGGTENIIMNIYRNIDRTKVQFDFLVHTNKECFFDDEIKSLGGNIYHVCYYNMLNVLTYRRQLHDFFKSHREFSAVHGHLGSCACIYFRVARKFNLPTIAHSHAINDKQKNLKNFLYRIHAYFSRGAANFYMGCSYEAGRDRYGRKIAEGKKFKIIKNGINASNYMFNAEQRRNMRRELGVTDRFIIGNVGRLCYVKNHSFMIDVLKELKKTHNDSCLLLVGDGELKTDISRKAADLGLEDSVIFTGVRKDVAEVLQAMDFFIFPSFNEGLGIGLIEAQAAGLQAIANAEGVLPSTKITPLVEFIPISAGPQEWANHISESRQKDFVRQDMSDAIRNAGFDIAEVALWLQNFYCNLKSANNA